MGSASGHPDGSREYLAAMSRAEALPLGVALLAVGLLVLFLVSPSWGLGVALGGVALIRLGVTGRRTGFGVPRVPTRSPDEVGDTRVDEADRFNWRRPRDV